MALARLGTAGAGALAASVDALVGRASRLTGLAGVLKAVVYLDDDSLDLKFT